MVKRVDQTIARARRNRKETAIICVEIFNANQLRQELGINALEQVIFTIAARLRRSVGSSTEVGRYDDNSFVVIVESVKQPSLLRSLGLRVAAAVRRPVIFVMTWALAWRKRPCTKPLSCLKVLALWHRAAPSWMPTRASLLP